MSKRPARVKTVPCPLCKTILTFCSGDTNVSCASCNKVFKLQTVPKKEKGRKKSDEIKSPKSSSQSNTSQSNANAVEGVGKSQSGFATCVEEHLIENGEWDRNFDPTMYHHEVIEPLVLLADGETLSQVEIYDDGSAKISEVYMFLRPAPPAEIKSSGLHWFPTAVSMVPYTSRYMPLVEVQEMLQGLPKNLRDHGITNKLIKKQCFTLFCKSGKTLIVEIDSKNKCLAWLRAIHRILMNADRTAPDTVPRDLSFWNSIPEIAKEVEVWKDKKNALKNQLTDDLDGNAWMKKELNQARSQLLGLTAKLNELTRRERQRNLKPAQAKSQSEKPSIQYHEKGKEVVEKQREQDNLPMPAIFTSQVKLRALQLSDDDLAAAVAYMTDGSEISCYVDIGNDHVKKFRIFLTFRPDPDGNDETLHWRQGDLNEAHDSPSAKCSVQGTQWQSMPLRYISDIFVGKRAAAFKCDLGARAKMYHCFSLISKNASLNVEADSIAQASLWLNGVHGLLTKKKSSSLEETRKAAAVAAAAPSAANPPAAAASTPNQDLEKCLARIRQGNQFVKYDIDPVTNHGTSQDVFIFYADPVMTETGIGGLYWCKPGERVRSSTCCFPFDTIKEMAIGKQTPALLCSAAKNADPALCFSLKAVSGPILSLQAESRGKLALWLNSIHQLLTQVKSLRLHKVDSEAAAQPGLDPADFGLAHALNRFRQYIFDERYQATHVEDVIVWYEEDPRGGAFGLLRYGNAKLSQAEILTTGQYFPLHHIEEMCLGKQTRALQSDIAAAIDSSRFFTLFTKNGILNLEAESPSMRIRWLNEIHRLLTQSGEMRSHRIDKSAASPGELNPATAQAIVAMRKGALFYMYDIEPQGTTTIKEVAVWYDCQNIAYPGHGLLYWDEPNRMCDSANCRTFLRLDTIMEMTSGKQTKVFSSRMGSKADDNRCFSLHSPDVVLNLEADTKETRLEWLNAVHRLLTDSGKTAEANQSEVPFGEAIFAHNGGLDLADVMAAAQAGNHTTEQNPAEIYQLLAKIGQGSYGSVYKALDKRSNTIVAVKLLECNEDSLEDIRKEINFLDQFRSEFIVGLSQVHRKGKQIWIAMEYCAAGSLNDMMTVCHTTLTESQIAVVMKMSLHGLDYLHGRNIIHRDVKAANILVKNSGECKLADFGVSAEMASTLSGNRTVIGTPCWMAPEVIRASNYNDKADIWSLGITAIELAVGHPPHSDVHPMTAMFKIPSSPPPTLPNPDKWSAEFKSFVHMCLQMDAELRPSAAQLLERHPFIQAAGGPELVLEFIEKCMLELKSLKDIGEAKMGRQEDVLNSQPINHLVGSTLTYG